MNMVVVRLARGAGRSAYIYIINSYVRYVTRVRLDCKHCIPEHFRVVVCINFKYFPFI